MIRFSDSHDRLLPMGNIQPTTQPILHSISYLTCYVHRITAMSFTAVHSGARIRTRAALPHFERSSTTFPREANYAFEIRVCPHRRKRKQQTDSRQTQRPHPCCTHRRRRHSQKDSMDIGQVETLCLALFEGSNEQLRADAQLTLLTLQSSVDFIPVCREILNSSSYVYDWLHKWFLNLI